jgi:hypothetical protein
VVGSLVVLLDCLLDHSFEVDLFLLATCSEAAQQRESMVSECQEAGGNKMGLCSGAAVVKLLTSGFVLLLQMRHLSSERLVPLRHEYRCVTNQRVALWVLRWHLRRLDHDGDVCELGILA